MPLMEPTQILRARTSTIPFLYGAFLSLFSTAGLIDVTAAPMTLISLDLTQMHPEKTRFT